MPGRAHTMSDGWETRRRRGTGHDWVIVKLATEGTVRARRDRYESFQKGLSDTASIEGSTDEKELVELLPQTKLQAHTRHSRR